MREIRKKQSWGLISLLLFLIMVSIGYFVIYPSVEDLRETNLKVAAKEKDVFDMQNKVASLEKLSAQLTNNPDKVNMLELAIPDDDAPAEVIESLSNIASSTGTDLISFSNNKSKDGDFTDLSVSFESSYQGFKLMLEDLQRNIRFTNVKSINLSRNISEEGFEGFVSGSINVGMFKYNKAKSFTGNSILNTTANQGGLDE